MNWEEFCSVNKTPPRYRNASLDNAKDLSKSIIAQGKDWCKNPTSLLLTGEAGRGKTYFAYSLARFIVNKYDRSILRWIKCKNLDDDIMESTNIYKSSKNIIQTYVDIPVLFLDDLGIERGTDRAERDFFEILDKRWENESITIISSNLSHEQIENTYGTRIFSRLKDFKWVWFNGPDLRGKDL